MTPKYRLFARWFDENTAWLDPPVVFDDGDMSPYFYQSGFNNWIMVILLCGETCLTKPGAAEGPPIDDRELAELLALLMDAEKEHG